MNYRNGGIQIAKRLKPELEKLTGDECVSRWIFSEAHESQEFHLTIAATDLADIARSDYVILAPLSGTSRGVHVEMGLAIALDKPCYLFRPEAYEGVGFDVLCLPWKLEWREALDKILSGEAGD